MKYLRNCCVVDFIKNSGNFMIANWYNLRFIVQNCIIVVAIFRNYYLLILPMPYFFRTCEILFYYWKLTESQVSTELCAPKLTPVLTKLCQILMTLEFSLLAGSMLGFNPFLRRPPRRRHPTIVQSHCCIGYYYRFQSGRALLNKFPSCGVLNSVSRLLTSFLDKV